MAVVAVDAGEDVFVADSSAIEIADDETNRYFDELSHDLVVGIPDAPVIDMPIRVIEDLAPAPSTPGVVEPFVGSGLRGWADGCLASPYGFLYSRVAERKDATMRSSRGERFEVAAIGSIELGPDLPQLVLGDWLCAQARDRDIDVSTNSPLQRVVFEDGHVLGAVIDTPSGTCAVHARRGVLVSTGRHTSVPPYRTAFRSTRRCR